MSPLPTIGTDGSSGISASYLNQLIQRTMTIRQRPLDSMKENKDQLEIQKAVYSDLSGMLDALKTQVENLRAGSSVLSGKVISSGDESILTATASSSAAAGTYTVNVGNLATAQRVASRPMLATDAPLGYAGKFYLGGAANPDPPVLSNAGEAGTVANPQRAALAQGQTQLDTGQYYLETRNAGTTETPIWQFRLVDRQGQAVAIADASNNQKYTADWQKWAAKPGYDTGRGLQIDLGQQPTKSPRMTDAATITWQAKGTEISVSATDTLENIRNTINAAAYPAGRGVQASIVNRSLVLTATSTGKDHGLGLDPQPTNSDLLGADQLDLFHDGAWQREVKGQDASVTISGVPATPSSNTGLTDLIPGLTINLKKASPDAQTTFTLAVNDDTGAIKNQVNSFVSQFNKVLSYLEGKTAVTKNSDGTYTRGGMAGESVFSSLRFNLIRDVLTPPTGLSPTAPQSFEAIGLKLDTGDVNSDQSIKLALSDSSALDQALANNRSGVLELLDKATAALDNRLKVFTGSGGVLAESGTKLDQQIKTATDRINREQENLDSQEKMLTTQYSTLLAQLAQAQNDFYTTSVYMSYNQLV